MRLKTISTYVLLIGLFTLPHFASAVPLINPLGITDPRLLIGRLIQAILSVVGSIALLMFVYGGVLWITSMGESARIDKGKKILVWAVLGLAMIAASYVVVNAVILALTQGNVNGAQ